MELRAQQTLAREEAQRELAQVRSNASRMRSCGDGMRLLCALAPAGVRSLAVAPWSCQAAAPRDSRTTAARAVAAALAAARCVALRRPAAE
jgi:hypothetical protein